MTKNERKIVVPAAALCFFLALAAVSAHAREIKPTAIPGMEYTIYLYNAEIGSMNISFADNLSFMVDTYDGFGLYLPIGSLFTAFYWAPNYVKGKDLLLVFNGVAVADFISGWGLALPNYNLTGVFLFLGMATH